MIDIHCISSAALTRMHDLRLANVCRMRIPVAGQAIP